MVLARLLIHLRLDVQDATTKLSFMLQLWGCYGGQTFLGFALTHRSGSVNPPNKTWLQSSSGIFDTFGTNYGIKCGLFRSLSDKHLSWPVLFDIVLENPVDKQTVKLKWLELIGYGSNVLPLIPQSNISCNVLTSEDPRTFWVTLIFFWDQQYQLYFTILWILRGYTLEQWIEKI